MSHATQSAVRSFLASSFGSLLFMLLCYSPTASAQTSREFAVMLHADVSKAPTPSITLRWNKDTNGKSIEISRKRKTESAWSRTPLVTLDSTIEQWTDKDVDPGVGYDYRVVRYVYKQLGTDATGTPFFGGWFATGYISTGMEVLPKRRSRALVVVDSTMRNTLNGHLNTLRTDLESEGWSVTIIGAPRAESFDRTKVEVTRSLIKAEATNGEELGAIILIGRVPVLYSGLIAPDGHADHAGAWPADAIYGDLDGAYTDHSVNYPNTSRLSQNNVPADGKYDQSAFATDIDVPVGRIDFYNMPAFTSTEPVTEVSLIKAYLDRNHDFRSSNPSIRPGGIIDDNFGSYKEMFAASAWRLFGLFHSDTSVKTGDYFGSLATPPTYLMGYGCGGGTDTSAGGIGRASEMVTKPIHAVFTFLFGSYFGDWDTRNNLLRASLASKPDALTSAWSGRPHWYAFHMALGEPIGYSARITQNATVATGFWSARYFVSQTGEIDYTPTGLVGEINGFDKEIHIALLGDPTLRANMTPVARIATVTASTVFPNKVKLNWVRPTGDVDAYLVYRRRGLNKNFILQTPSPITEMTFTDSTRFEGEMEYAVQAVALRSSASGTFYDYGKMTIAKVTTTGIEENTGLLAAASTLSVAPNPAQTDVSFRVTVAPTSGHVAATTLTVHDMLGRIMWSYEEVNLMSGTHTIGFNASTLAEGRYIVRLTTDGVTTTTPLTIAR